MAVTTLDTLLEKLQVWFAEGQAWVQDNLLDPTRLFEVAAIVLALWLGRVFARFCLKFVDILAEQQPIAAKLNKVWVYPVLSALIGLLLLWTARFGLEPVLGDLYLLPLATSLTGAWVLIRIVVSFIRSVELARLVALGVWTLAALNILGVLPRVVSVLDGAVLPLGEAKISVLDIITGTLSFAIFIWVALVVSRIIEARVQGFKQIPASAQVLIAKSARIVLLGLAFLLALNATGIDLTALAVFGGALGVGIGFGLQKVVGNFISGLILLLDRSIKPGDVIETAGTYGRINKLAARYTSVITRDGTEYLIPNEDMITQAVVNWSHSDLLVRRRIPVQVAYTSDIRKAMDLMIEAALEEGRVVRRPEPRTLVRNFGENGVDLELRMWIEDPENGVSNIASDVMLRIWDKFHDANIEFPYPQRVIHYADSSPQGMPPATQRRPHEDEEGAGASDGTASKTL